MDKDKEGYFKPLGTKDICAFLSCL